LTDLGGPFHPDDDLTLDLGLDSLMLVEILAMLEKEYGVLIPESEIPELRTIGDILRRLPDSQPKTAVEEKTLTGARGAGSLEDFFNLERGAFTKTLMRAVQIITRLIVLIAFRAKIRDTDKLPTDRAVLICPNHQSMIDPILVFALLPGWMLDKLLFTGFGEYFAGPPLSWLVRPFRIILTGTAGTYGESLRLASEGLKRGMSVCIFPEGERTGTGKVMKPRIGAGLLSVENGVPIVPVYIDGASSTLSPINPELRFPAVTLTVMDPIEQASGAQDKNDLYDITVEKWLSAMKEMEGRAGRPHSSS
jgi:acyl carrier protein